VIESNEALERLLSVVYTSRGTKGLQLYGFLRAKRAMAEV